MKAFSFIILAALLASCSNLRIQHGSSGTKVKSKVVAKKDAGKKNLKKNISINKEDELYFELSGENFQKLSESEIYKKILEKYKHNDLRAVVALTNLLVNKYPMSIHADNALYLCGNLAFVEKQYGRSLEYYNRIINGYPQSNKAVSALFAKGVLFKRMNLMVDSEKAFIEVSRKYPGSPEAMRSEIERKLLR